MSKKTIQNQISLVERQVRDEVLRQRQILEVEPVLAEIELPHNFSRDNTPHQLLWKWNNQNQMKSSNAKLDMN